MSSLSIDDYRFATLDMDDASDDAARRRRAWLGAVRRGFHDSRPSEEYEKLWLTHCAADGVVNRGAWLPDGAFGAGDTPVATIASFDKTLNTGRELLPLRMISDVTTSPAHRRRGLVRRLIESDLDDAVARGIPVAALTVSEATIYGRWGFGAATFLRSVEIDTGPRFALRAFDDDGRVELLDQRTVWPHLKPLLDRFHATHRGSVEWPQFYEPFFTGTYHWSEDGEDKKSHAAVHLDAAGAVDGVVLYSYAGRDGEKRKVSLGLFLAESPTATLALWRFVGGIDNVNHVEWGQMAPDDPLPWALVDINSVRYTKHEEFLWIRVLDVVRALEARPWTADGRVVLGVDDAQGHAAGRFAVDVADGVARVERTDDAAEVELTAEALGSLYLGGVGVGTLHAAGRLRGPADAVGRFGAMADLPTEPYNLTGF